jgi:hypothetical protein
MADGQAAIGYTRKNAARFGVNPQRTGIMVFLASGTVASSVGFNYTAVLRDTNHCAGPVARAADLRTGCGPVRGKILEAKADYE